MEIRQILPPARMIARAGRWFLAGLTAAFVVLQSTGAPAQSPEKQDRQITIRMMPGVYMPGMRPTGVGPRVTELKRAIDDYEALHPNVRIVLVSSGGADVMEGEYIKTQIMGGIAADIVQINVEAVWPDVDKGWWIPLDEYFDRPNPYIPEGEPGSERWWDAFANVALTKAKRAPDGNLYCLVFDLVEIGIFYNREIFRKHNITFPKTWTEFLELQKNLKEHGYVPMALSVFHAYDWAQDYLFDQMYFPVLDQMDRIKDAPEEAEYLQGYLTAKELAWNIIEGNISAQDPRYRETWRLIREWREYWPRDISRADLNRLFLLQRSPMMWHVSPHARRLLYDEMVDFEWGVFYLPPVTEECSPLGTGIDPSVLGGAGTQYSVTRMAKDRGHLDQVMDFLAFLSTPQYGGAIVNEAQVLIPNFAGVDPDPLMEPFEEILQLRYTTTKWTYTFDNRFNDTNRRLIELFLGDALTLDEFLVRMDRNNREAAERLINQQKWTFEEPEWR